MKILVDTSLESRKEWTAPELKKIDIDEITAGTLFAGDDGLGGGS